MHITLAKANKYCKVIRAHKMMALIQCANNIFIKWPLKDIFKVLHKFHCISCVERFCKTIITKIIFAAVKQKIFVHNYVHNFMVPTVHRFMKVLSHRILIAEFIDKVIYKMTFSTYPKCIHNL